MSLIEQVYIPSRQKTDDAELDAWIEARVGAPKPFVPTTGGQPSPAGENVPTIGGQPPPSSTTTPEMSLTMTPQGPAQAPEGREVGAPPGSPGAVIGRLPEMALSGLSTAFTAMFDPPVADRVIRYLGGTPSNIPEEITRDLTAAGVDPSLLPGLVPMIEGAISQVHTMGPGKPPRAPATGTPEAAATREAAFQSPGRFNPARQQAATTLTNLTAQINVDARNMGLMTTHTRGTVTHENTLSAATELIKSGKMSAERILGFEPGTILTAEEGTAARMIRDATHKRISQLMHMADAGDEGAKGQLASGMYLASKIEAATEAASGTEPARALSARRILSRPKGMSLSHTMELIRLLQEGPLTPEAEQAITKAAAGVQRAVKHAKTSAKTPHGTAAVEAIEAEVDAAIAAIPAPGQLLGSLWDIILRGTVKAEEQAIDPDLLQMILTRTQDAINSAVPPGQLLGGLWQEMLEGAAHAQQTIDPDTLLAFWRHLANETEQQAMVTYFANTTRTGRVLDAFLEARAAGLLTIRSIGRNLVGSAASTIWSIPERAATAMTGVVRGTDEGAYAHEALDMLHGIWNAQMDALITAGKTLKTGESHFLPGATQTEQVMLPAISSDALGITGPMGRFVDVLGELIRLPFRGLAAGDDYFKFINYEAQKYALAYRRYRQLLAQGATNTEATAEYTTLITHPPAWLDEAASEHSLYTTFNDDVINPLGQLVMDARAHESGWGQAARFIIPYARTPMNVMGYGAERTPGLNFLSAHYHQEILAGGVRKDAAYGRLALGSGVFMAFVGLAMDGHIHGKGPKNPKLRDLYRQNGWSPYSINLPGMNPIPFLGFSPLSEILGQAADFAELVHQGGDEASLLKLAGAMVLSSASVMEEYPMLQGLADIADAIRQTNTRSEGMILQALGSTMPLPGVQGTARTIQGLTDPSQRETRSPHGGRSYLGREVDDLWEELASRTPWLSNYQYPKRDILGQPMLRQGGWWTPAPTSPSAQEEHPVIAEMVKHKISVGRPPKAFGKGRQREELLSDDPDATATILTPAEWDRFQELAGTITDNGLTLDHSLRQMITSTEYQDASDGPRGGKADLIRLAFQEYRQLAKEQMLEEQRTNGQPGRLEQLMNQKEDIAAFEKLDKADQARARPDLERRLGRSVNIGILR